MKTIKVIQPGEPGTKKLAQRYGNKLICVRYRHDPLNGRKLKTIELVIEEHECQANSEKIPMNKIMHIKIAFEETQLRNRVKGMGGRWNPNLKAWQLPYGIVLKMKLEERIIKDI